VPAAFAWFKVQIGIHVLACETGGHLLLHTAASPHSFILAPSIPYYTMPSDKCNMHAGILPGGKQGAIRNGRGNVLSGGFLPHALTGQALCDIIYENKM
jgi:hypothetical protein